MRQGFSTTRRSTFCEAAQARLTAASDPRLRQAASGLGPLEQPLPGEPVDMVVGDQQPGAIPLERIDMGAPREDGAHPTGLGRPGHQAGGGESVDVGLVHLCWLLCRTANNDARQNRRRQQLLLERHGVERSHGAGPQPPALTHK